MAAFDPSTHSHRRLNPLTNEYVLVSPHRMKRPWLGQIEPPQLQDLPPYDSACYLCPGNKRAGDQLTPLYESTFVFENDFAAILPPPEPSTPVPAHPLLALETVQGSCDVLIFHPRHDLTLANLHVHEISHVIDEWIRIYEKRGREDGIRHVQIFENKGAMMGCSNPHPHGQIWSSSTIPTLPATELASLRKYALSTVSSSVLKGPHDRPCLLCDYAHYEVNVPVECDSRVVAKNEHWVAVVPWWAIWPFEILLLPYHRHIASISELTPEERLTFAQILSRVTIRYDNLFSCAFAYSMGIHQRPTPPAQAADPAVPEAIDDFAHLHIHFDPPLLRSANVRKFLVGYELMSEPQRDLTPEQAASRLRACSEIHYFPRKDDDHVE